MKEECCYCEKKPTICEKCCEKFTLDKLREMFDVFDKYACIKNDKWYLDLKKRHLLTFDKSKGT